MGLEKSSVGPKVDVGYFTQSATSVTTGFRPTAIWFWSFLHQGSFNSEYSSGANTGGGANSYSWSCGYATGAAAGDQLVSALGANSDSMDAHTSFVGDGEVVYLIYTDTRGANILGRSRANVSAINSDGFDVSFTSTVTPTCITLYKAIQ